MPKSYFNVVSVQYTQCYGQTKDDNHQITLTLDVEGQHRTASAKGKTGCEALHAAFTETLAPELGAELQLPFPGAPLTTNVAQIVTCMTFHFEAIFASSLFPTETEQNDSTDHHLSGTPAGREHRHDGPSNDEHRPLRATARKPARRLATGRTPS